MNDQPIIEITNLTKQFKSFWGRIKVTAVNDLSLQITPGRILGLLGPNGSGKSTTLKLTLGLLHPTQGRVTIWGQAPQAVAVRQKLGYLPEVAIPYPYLNATETIHFYGSLFNLPQKAIKERTQALLDALDLTHAANRPVGEYSHGMRRRIGLAQALINNPSLIVLDEPTSGLDPDGRHRVKSMISQLASKGKTIIITSHLLGDLQDICHDIAIMSRGQLLAAGNMRDLLKNPDRIRFETDTPPPDQIEQIKQIITTTTGTPPVVDHPDKRLESFFRSTVSQQAQPITADATLPIPDFLCTRSDHE